MENNKSSIIPMLGGIAFALTGIFKLIDAFSVLRHGFRGSVIITLISALLCCALAFSLLTQRRDIIMPACFSAYAVIALLNFNIFDFGSFFAIPIKLVYLALMVSLALICFGKFTNYLNDIYKAIPESVWLPLVAILAGINGIYDIISLLWHGSFVNILRALIWVAALILAMLWALYPSGLPKNAPVAATATVNQPIVNVSAATAVPINEAYYDMVKHILLCVFTLGIWPMIWIFRTTENLNKVPGTEQFTPVYQLLLCLFVPFYQIYWLYKHGQKIDIMANGRINTDSNMATICLLLGLLSPMVAYILIQDRINTICANNK